MQQTILSGRYEIEQKIGEGGMATVYRGLDRRLNRRVAIKVLHSHYVHDPDFLRRFEHEAKAAANLSHSNAVSVYDTGQDGDTYYIVMEYIDGVDLKTLINREAPLSIARAIAITEAIAQGLEAAHHIGLIHRDIKPQNILVTPDGHVRITDFGIAKSHLSTAQTQTGMTFGTADYISPEQAQGQQATPQSDIYSLGVTIYEMLAGRLPYTGDSPVSVAMKHVSAPLPPLRSLNPQVPANLEHIILKALSKEPSARPASAREFAEALRNYRNVAEQPTAANPVHPHSATTRVVPTPSSQRPAQPAHPNVASHRPTYGQGSSGSSSTASRATIPAPRPAIGRAPQQGIGCGVFIVGMVILAGVIGLVLLFSSGILNDMIGGIDNPPTAPPAAITTPTPDQTATPTESPTPTITPTPVPMVRVPNIVGLAESEARQTIQGAGLVPVNSGESRYHDTIPQGSVLDQMVPSGIDKPEGHPVTYTLSLGAEFTFVNVPDLSGMRFEAAQSQAQALGLSVEKAEEPGSLTQGFVLRQEPGPGTRIKEGERIQLVVSLGDVVWMPNLFNLSEDEAKAQLEQTDGLQWAWSDYQGIDKLGDKYFQVPPCTVVSTQPDKDQWVQRGTGVTLGVRECN